ncbi:uncharacterized protein LOC118809628 [Colossoma macropomum]|uniref:uncharacterized protein LOC118809628 n=1 Tax=Colossoma macropomum TaxID=42526 RepID=UPI001864A114|nr:uncharacterized protein LOC118809628 [Colossoma macropomum]
MGLTIFLFLSGVLFICDGLHVLGPSGPLTAKLGVSVMLPCYVEAPVPPEELKVEWKRTDSETLVHLFQDGESKPEAQDQAYSGRASFFTEEVKHGNFSLLLTNLVTNDAGVYNCTVYRQQETGQTSVKIEIGHVVSAYTGEDITMDCSVDFHIPPEKLEVSWIKVDQQIPVLIFQNGEVQTESTHERYIDRVEFLSPEERQKGNFSLRLKDLRTEDKGLYVCKVFSGDFSANTTVKVLQLGFSSMHTGILCLCILALFLCALAVWPAIRNTLGPKVRNNNSRKTLAIRYELVFCPNIAVFLAFIFWGATEGFITEAATCSALNLLRILSLLWIAPYLDAFQEFSTETAQKILSLFRFSQYLITIKESVRRFVKRSTVALEYAVIATVTYSSLFGNFSSADKVSQAWIGVLFIILPLFFINIIIQGLIKRFSETYSIWNYGFAEVTNFGRMAAIGFLGVQYKTLSTVIALLPYLPLFLIFLQISVLKAVLSHSYGIRTWRSLFLIWMLLLLILEVLNASLSVYIHNVILESNDALNKWTETTEKLNERAVRTCVAAYLYILTLMLLLEYLFSFCARLYTGSNSDSPKRPQSTSLLHASVYMLGAVGLIFVNSVALVVELILKARNGERTMDLRVILIPSECVFALCCFALQISAFWRTFRENFMDDIEGLRRLCTCPVNTMIRNCELRSLQSTEADPTPAPAPAPAPQELGS